ncbi:hypothetical protein L6N65_004356 [Escherichia coli]|nr:hypothetical protein [Escherichia coli]EIV8348257.1 hypothetical protein [Escherichia coli]
MRLRILVIILTAFACINTSYAGIAQLSSSSAKISYIYNTELLWTNQSQNINIQNGWGKISLDIGTEVKEIGSALPNFSSSIESSSTYPVYGHPDISVNPGTDLISLNSTLAKGAVYSDSAGGTYWHYGVTNATINNAYSLGIQDSYHQNTNMGSSPTNRLQCLFPQRVLSDHSDVKVTYKIIQKFVETWPSFEIKVIGECSATYSGVATTLELTFPEPVLDIETTTNFAEVETVLNTKIVNGIQNRAPKFNLTVDSPPENVSVFIKKDGDYIKLPTEISDPSQMERSDTIKIKLVDLKTGKHTYPLRFIATII